MNQIINNNLPPLPEEILIKVFSYLKPVDLAACSRVSQLWLSVASDKMLWKPLFFELKCSELLNYLSPPEVLTWKEACRFRRIPVLFNQVFGKGPTFKQENGFRKSFLKDGHEFGVKFSDIWIRTKAGWEILLNPRVSGKSLITDLDIANDKLCAATTAGEIILADLNERKVIRVGKYAKRKNYPHFWTHVAIIDHFLLACNAQNTVKLIDLNTMKPLASSSTLFDLKNKTVNTAELKELIGRCRSKR